MIKHILADGTELTDITGHKVPRTEQTEAAYRIIAEILEGGQRDGTAQRGIQAHYAEA
jgi:hypothetical protein